MQIGSTLMLNLAKPYNFVMVMQDFRREKMNLTRKQRAHDQGAHPEVSPESSPGCQLNHLNLAARGLKLLDNPASVYDTKELVLWEFLNLPFSLPTDADARARGVVAKNRGLSHFK